MKKARIKVAMVARPRASHVHVLASNMSCGSREIGMHVSISIKHLYRDGDGGKDANDDVVRG